MRDNKRRVIVRKIKPINLSRPMKIGQTLKIEMKYDGPVLAGHSMDVRELAPALMAFGDLCKEANLVINKDRAGVQVLVNADIKANCITISFDIIQTIFEATRSFIQNEYISTGKEILEWIGILKWPTAGAAGTAGAVSLLKFLRKKKNKKIDRVTSIRDENGNTMIQVNFSGDGNVVTVSPQVYDMSKNKKILQSASSIMAPVSLNDGINSLSFKYGDVDGEEIDKAYASEIIETSIEEELSDVDEEEVQFLTAHITVYQPTLEQGSKHWKFILNEKKQSIDISSTTIAQDTISRGKIVIGDTWKVKLEVREKKTESGYKLVYKAIEVLDFIAGEEQIPLSLSYPSKSID